MAGIPMDFHTLTPSLTVRDAKGAIALYEKALGAESQGVMMDASGQKVMHAMLQIGSSKLFINDEFPEMEAIAPAGVGKGPTFYVYVDDVDAAHARAVNAGMTEKHAPQDMFWGDRTSVATDPYGQVWTFASHVRDVSEAEMKEAMKTFGA